MGEDREDRQVQLCDLERLLNERMGVGNSDVRPHLSTWKNLWWCERERERIPIERPILQVQIGEESKREEGDPFLELIVCEREGNMKKKRRT